MMIPKLLDDAGLRRISRALVLAALCMGLLFTSTITQAAVEHGIYGGAFLSDGKLVNGTGDGWMDSKDQRWFEYINPTGGPNWWNQWYFNSPDIRGSKWIEYDFWIEALGTWEVEVAINWSNQNWNDPAAPPLPGDDPYIVRYSVYQGSSGINNRGNPLWIPDYNPVWVSFDIRLLDPDGIPQQDPVVFFGGEIWHEHIPIPVPSTFFLLGAGMIGLACGIRRRKLKE